MLVSPSKKPRSLAILVLRSIRNYIKVMHIFEGLTSVEFSRELDLCSNLLVVVREGILGKLDA